MGEENDFGWASLRSQLRIEIIGRANQHRYVLLSCTGCSLLIGVVSGVVDHPWEWQSVLGFGRTWYKSGKEGRCWASYQYGGTLWRLVGHGKGGRTSEEELACLGTLENEPSGKVRRKDPGKSKFQVRKEVGVSYRKIEGRRELLSSPSTIPHMMARGSIWCCLEKTQPSSCVWAGQ